MGRRNIMKKPAPTTWNAVEYLKTGEDIALYRDAGLEDGDPALVAAALGEIACARGSLQVARDSMARNVQSIESEN